MSNPPPYNITHLDTLLSTYLNLLDTYTQQRTTLSTHLSSGFFSLAQAQRSSMLPPGQRYGQEMYDQRMKAVRRVKFKHRANAQDHEEDDDAAAAAATKDAEEETEANNETAARRKHGFEIYQYPSASEPNTTSSFPQPEIISTPTSLSQDSTNSPPLPPPNPSSKTTSPPPIPQHPKKPKNPLHQFGLLTPPALRTSQNAFTSALSTIPDLLNTSRALAELEEEIGKVRASLGLSDVSKEIEAVDDEDETMDGKAEMDSEVNERIDTKVASPTSPRRRSLASRSKMSEPRSKVLKLGT